MSFVVAWIPAVLMGVIFAIAGFVLIARERRRERLEAEERVGKAKG